MSTTPEKDSVIVEIAEQPAERRADPERDRKTVLVEKLAPPPQADAPRPRRRVGVMALLGGCFGLLLLMVLQQVTLRPAPKTSKDRLQALLGRIDRMMDVEDWQSAISAAHLGLDDHPRSVELAVRRKRAEFEQRNRWCYDSFHAALKRQNDEAALALFAELPEESVYRVMARPDAERLRDGYLQSRLERARAATQLGLCDEVLRIAQAIEQLVPQHKEARELSEGCQAAPRRASKKSEVAMDFQVKKVPRAGSVTGLRNPFE